MESYHAKKNEKMHNFFKKFFMREKSYGDAYSYINPWHAAMDDFIEKTGWEAKSSRKTRKKTNVHRLEPRRPEMRL